MAEPFEVQLHKLFQESPSLPDAPLFAARLTARLERDWTLRRLLIGFTGGAVGLAALWQFMGASGVSRAFGAMESSTGVLTRQADMLSLTASSLQQVFPYSTEVMWLLGGLLVLGAGLLATRVVDEF